MTRRPSQALRYLNVSPIGTSISRIRRGGLCRWSDSPLYLSQANSLFPQFGNPFKQRCATEKLSHVFSDTVPLEVKADSPRRADTSPPLAQGRPRPTSRLSPTPFPLDLVRRRFGIPGWRRRTRERSARGANRRCADGRRFWGGSGLATVTIRRGGMQREAVPNREQHRTSA